MKKTNKIVSAILIGFLVLVTAQSLYSKDWPQWRGTNRDGMVTGFKAPETWPAQLPQKWAVTVGFGDSTPALKDNKLYVFTRQGSDEVLQCLDAENGKELWRDKYAAQAVTGPAARHPGPRSSPTVADGKVVTFGAGGVLSCLDAATGKVLWRNEAYTDAVPQFFTSMSPIVVDGMLISHLGGKDKGVLLALDLTTGKEKWKLPGDGPAYGSPALMSVGGTKQVVVLTEKNMISVAASDGKLLWQVPAPNATRFFSCATPVIDGDKVYYTGQGHGTKAVKIEKNGDNVTVKTLWSNDDLGTTFNTPIIKDNFLFGISKLGNIFCINAQTGKTTWISSIKLDRFGSVVNAGSVLLGLSPNSELVVFKPDNNAYTELARFKVAETPTQAHPVVSGNRIFIKDSENLAMRVVE
ncbi:PQQ-binding-like beta-propeller repeat protein [Thermodesulfobacteriota bacterium]